MAGHTPDRSRRFPLPGQEPLEVRRLRSGLATEVRRLSVDHLTPLFDGRTLTGWRPSSRALRAVARGGEIRLNATRNAFLVSHVEATDFALELEAWVPKAGNSGIQFRSRQGPAGLLGYQADVDSADRNWAGGLWDSRTGWVQRPRVRAPIRSGGWNHYRIEALGPSVRIFVNGTQTVSFVRAQARPGLIGLQHHGEGGVYRFRDIGIEIWDSVATREGEDA